MLKGKRMAVGSDQLWQCWGIWLVKGLAFVDVMACCKRKKSFQQRRAFQAEGYETPEGISVGVIYDEKLADAFVI